MFPFYLNQVVNKQAKKAADKDHTFNLIVDMAKKLSDLKMFVLKKGQPMAMIIRDQSGLAKYVPK